MNMSNKTYDTIKWIALSLIPAMEALILTVGKIWGLPHYAEIGATVAAAGIFLAAIIKKSSKAYYQKLDEHAVGEAIEEDGDQGEFPEEAIK